MRSSSGGRVGPRDVVERMTNRTAQEYLDAAARVPDMDDEELCRWYAHAVQSFTRLSLFERLDLAQQGIRSAQARAGRQEWCDAAAELFVAIENRIEAETTKPRPLMLLSATVSR